METIGALKELIKAEQTHDTTIPALSHKKLIKHWRIWSKQTHETAIQAWSHHSFVETSAMLTGPTKAEKKLWQDCSSFITQKNWCGVDGADKRKQNAWHGHSSLITHATLFVET